MGVANFTTPLRRFDGGLNLKSIDVDVAYNQLLRAQNCRLIEQTVRTAPGFTKYSYDQLDGKVKYIWGDLINSAYKFVIAAGTEIVTASGGVYTPIKTGLNADAKVDMDLYSKRLFIGNGVDPNMKYDGTTVSNHGIVAPLANFTLTEVNPGAGAFANGQVRQFYVTFWDDVHKVESNPNPLSQSITIAAGPSNIQLNTFPATSDTNVTHYRIYMTEDGGATWLRKDQISYATYVGGNYVISNATNGTLVLEFDNNPPGIYYLVEYFKNRLYIVEVANKAYLKFSKEYRPEQFPPDFRLGMGDAFDENIVCLARFYDYLIIGTNRGIWALDGDPLLEGSRPYRVTGYVGVAGQQSYAILDNLFAFVGTDKRIYALDPTQFSKVDVRPKYISELIEPLFQEIPSNTIADSVGIFYHLENRYEAMFSVHLDSSTLPTPEILNSVLVLDAKAGGWSVDDKRVTAFGLVTDSNNNTMLYHGDENGYIYLENSGLGYGATVNSSVTGATVTTLSGTGEADIISTATSGGAATLTDTTQVMVPNLYIGFQIFISSGTGAGQYRTILTNTVDTFTVSVAWTTAPDGTSGYIVGGFIENSLNGLDAIINGGTGVGQRRFITSHTPTTLTISPVFDEIPGVGSTFSVGAIDFDVWTGWDTHTEIVEHTKRGWFFHVSAKEAGSYALEFYYLRDLDYSTVYDYTVSLFQFGALWGVDLWGTGLWKSAGSLVNHITFDGTAEYYERVQQRFRNRFAGQPITINYLCVTGQDKGMMI